MATVFQACGRLWASDLRSDDPLTVLELLEAVYGVDSAAVATYRRRAAVDHSVIRANLDAGYPASADFFREVWPRALEALRRESAEERAKPGAAVGLVRSLLRVQDLYRRGIYTESEVRAEENRVREAFGLEPLEGAEHGG